MISQPGCPSKDQLERLIDETLADSEQANLTAHLERCEQCRERLESLVAGGESWAAVRHLADPPASETKEQALGRVIQALESGAGTSAEVQPGLDMRAFLEAADQPGCLGRLDHYRVLEEVGRGGMGVVYRGFDEKLHRIVALKVLSPHLASSATARERFTREARAAAAVNHPNIVTIYAVEDRGALPYLVMEFVDGPSLQQRIDQDVPLAIEEIVRLGMQIAAGLAAAHEAGIVHRDVKPANVLLEASGGRKPPEQDAASERGLSQGAYASGSPSLADLVPKLTDFGLARAVDDASLTHAGVIVGTPQYMAPEQARGEEADRRADQFALGSVLYALCTGQPPFRASSTLAVLQLVSTQTPRPIRELRPDVPAWLCEVIERLHANNPGDRFPSVRDVADLLAQHMAGERMLPARRRRRRVALLALAALVLIVAAVTPLLFQPGKTGTVQPEENQMLSPLDDLAHQDVPPYLRAVAAGGDAARAPRELVAVLGDSRFLLPNAGPASWPALSGDGTTLAVPCFDCIALFDAQTGQPRRALAGHEGRVFGVTFRPDGKRLAATVWGRRRSIVVWDLETVKVVRTLIGHRATVLRVAWSPDGNRLVSCSDDRTARVWDADTGQEKLTLTDHTGNVGMVCFGPGGKRIFTGSEDGSVRVWDATSGKRLAVLTGHSQSVTGIAFSPDGKWLATGSAAEAKLRDAATLQEQDTLPRAAVWLAFSRDGNTLLAARHDHWRGTAHIVRRWAVRTGKELAALSPGDRGGIAVYQLGHDGATLFALKSVPAASRLRVWDLNVGRERSFNEGHTGPVHTLAISPDGHLLASGGADHTVRLWDLASRKSTHTLTAHRGAVHSIVFSPDGARLASGGADGKIVLWDVRQGRLAGTLTGYSRKPSRLAFSPDGLVLAAGGADGAVYLWDFATGKAKAPLRRHRGAVRTVAFSPLGKWLASGGADGTVSLGDAGGEGALSVFRLRAAVADIAFSRDGKWLAAVGAGGEGRLHVWNTATHQEAISSEREPGVSLEFDPVGQRIVTVGRDARIHLWEQGPDIRRLRTWGRFGAALHQVAVTPEGRYLALASANGCIYLLRLAKQGNDGP
jgi:WD40 repeat protein/serine/threonine protein kinase